MKLTLTYGEDPELVEGDESILYMVAVAQQEERLPVEQEVAGADPVGHPSELCVISCWLLVIMLCAKQITES